MADDAQNKTATTDNGLTAETSLSKDGDLGINQTADTAKTDVPAAQTKTPAEDMVMSKPAVTTPASSAAHIDFTPPPSSQPVPAVDGAAEPLISAAEAGDTTPSALKTDTPVTINKEEAASADGLSAEASPESQLGEQVETLTGEIQALESKIERLEGNGSTPEAKPDTKMPEMPEKPTTPPMPMPPANPDTVLPPLPDAGMSMDKKAETTLPGEAAAKKDEVKVEAKPLDSAQGKPADKTAVATFSDIFAKSDKEKPDKKAADAAKNAAPTSLMPEATKPASETSTVGTLGEVLSFFGIAVLAILLLGPFYKPLISDSLYTTITSIAWLVAPVSLLIAFILMLFAKGKGLMKTVVFIMLLLSIVFYLGVRTSGTIGTDLNNVLGSLFSAYK